MEVAVADRGRAVGMWGDLAPDVVVLLYLLAAGISSIPIKSFEFSKACLVNLNVSRETCEDIVYRSIVKGHETEYSQVETLFTSIEVWMDVAKNVVAASIILFTGSFSDRVGRRKFFILLPIAFEIVSYVGLLIVELDFYGSGLVTVGLIRCLPGLTGGTSVLLMAVFSHIGDVTDESSRTSRIGRLTVVVLACQPIAYLVTPLVVVPGVTYPAILSSLVLFLLSAAVGIFFLKDRDPKPLPPRPFISFFRPEGIADAFKLICKNRPDNLRKIVISVTVINILTMAATTGENKVVYQYLKRKFSLDDKAISYYFTYSIIMLFLGTALMVNVFVKKCQMQDYIVGLLGNINKIMVNAGYAFARTPTALYIVTLFDVFTGCTSIGTRSIASKSVQSEELGKLFSVFGFTDLATPPIYALLYGYFYTYTKEKLTGAVFLLSYVFILPIAGLFLYTKRLQRNASEDEMNPRQADEQPEFEQTPSPPHEPSNGIHNQSFELSEINDKNISDIRL